MVKLAVPVKGHRLRALEKRRGITSGTSRVVLGGPGKMEVVIDELATEAVKVKPDCIRQINWPTAHSLKADKPGAPKIPPLGGRKRAIRNESLPVCYTNKGN